MATPRVAELRRLLRAASDRPWVYEGDMGAYGSGDIFTAVPPPGWGATKAVAIDHEGMVGSVEAADAALIVEAVNALPALLTIAEAAAEMDAWNYGEIPGRDALDETWAAIAERLRAALATLEGAGSGGTE